MCVLHLLAIEGGVLFDLPSGSSKIAFVPKSIILAFDDAELFCKDNGFDGLVEIRTLEDSHFLSMLIYCACVPAQCAYANRMYPVPSGTYTKAPKIFQQSIVYSLYFLIDVDATK